MASEEEKLQYNRLRNQVSKLTKKIKKIKEKTIARNAKSNPKAFWKYALSKLKTRPAIPDIQIPSSNPDDINYTSNDDEKSDVFLQYFSSVFTEEPPGDELPHFDKRSFTKELDNIEITREMVLKKLQKIKVNKSPGPDAIHPRVLKELSDQLSIPLTIIFQTSLRTKELPSDWKHANVSAIFKKGVKTLPQNYRPVSLTCIICKIMESIIRDFVIDHMKANNLFSDRQFGFINGRSTVLQLLHVIDLWTEILDEGGDIDVIYCDFMKAFDKVPHKRLIHKVKNYGITDKVLGWVESFLSGRTQCVKINSSISKNAPVTSGIPQGSVLGPILFVIYINDMPEVVDKNSFVYLFADDTKVFRKIACNLDSKTLQIDIDALMEWSNKWLLKFHPDKCVYMGIGYKNSEVIEKYHMGDHSLKISKCEKDIGVHIDSKLEFDVHISKAINKANMMLGISRRTFQALDKTKFGFIFKGIVRPHLEYGAPVWSPHLIKYKTLIENVQRRATKFIPGLYDTPYPERLRILKLPTLAYRRIRGDMIQVYKIMCAKPKEGGYDGTLPNFLTSERSCKYNLKKKNPKNLQILRWKEPIRKFCFSLRTRNIWNSLPEEVVNSKSVKSFEIALDRHWQDQPLMFDDYKADIDLRIKKYRL